MRIESSITSISWIPSEAVTGMTKGAFEIGVRPLRRAHRPTTSAPTSPTTLEELRAADRFRFANHLGAYVEFADDGSVVDAGYRGGGAIGATTVRFGKQLHGRGGEPARPAARTGGRRRLGALHPVRRRAHRLPDAAGGAPAAVRAVPRADRVVDARADDPRRRAQRGPARRGVAVPAPLGLRRRGELDRQERADRLQGLGRPRLRQAHAVGRRGVAGPRHRGRDRARAPAVVGDHARRRQAGDPHGQGGQRR